MKRDTNCFPLFKKGGWICRKVEYLNFRQGRSSPCYWKPAVQSGTGWICVYEPIYLGLATIRGETTRCRKLCGCKKQLLIDELLPIKS